MSNKNRTNTVAESERGDRMILARRSVSLTGLGSVENCLESCKRNSGLPSPLMSLSAAFSVLP